MGIALLHFYPFFPKETLNGGLAVMEYAKITNTF
jgi:hypothetical protein